ncbi:MAG TPA: hypothetical protein VFZ98_07460 [Vicinamibacterales bacterium]
MPEPGVTGTLADRLLEARLLEARLRAGAQVRRTVSQDYMADLVSAELGRALHKTQWRRYESGEREPPLDVIRAVARVSGLSESYIAFGSGTTDASSEASTTPRTTERPAGLAPTKSGLPLAPLVRPDEQKEEKKGTRRRRA